MRKQLFLLPLIIAFCTIISCDNQSATLLSSLKEKSDSITLLTNRIAEMEKQIKLLQFPANDRLNEIKKHFETEEFDKALSAIKELKEYFPKSNEIIQANEIADAINKKKAAIEAEKQRIKALGFKALPVAQKAIIGANTIIFSNCKIGSKFVHDVYPTYTGSSWFEHTADKGSKYISFNMDVTSTDKDPNIPTLAFYSINGSSLAYRDYFWVQFARWDNYGSYLGNEPDLKNDFSKVNTVKFRVGVEIEDDYLKKPYIVVLKKANTMVRKYERFKNPPVYYEGDPGYPGVLDIDDFNNGNYVAIKIENLK